MDKDQEHLQNKTLDHHFMRFGQKSNLSNQHLDKKKETSGTDKSNFGANLEFYKAHPPTYGLSQNGRIGPDRFASLKTVQMRKQLFDN